MWFGFGLISFEFSSCIVKHCKSGWTRFKFGIGSNLGFGYQNTFYDSKLHALLLKLGKIEQITLTKVWRHDSEVVVKNI